MVDVKAIQAEVTKKWGKGLSFIAGSKETLRINAISTGSLKLDVALGIGGMPRGRIVEIYGPESSGKTTICQTVIAEAQLLGLQCAFIDVEHALDLEYAEVCGVNIDELLMSQPDSAEQALDLVEIYAKHGVQVIVVDSVAALVPKAEIEGEMGDAHMALTARLMSQALRKLKKIISDTGSLLIFTNQLRHKIGVVFGSPETTTGGQALKFYASVRIDLRKRAPIQENNEAIGNIARAKIVKNKVAPPFRECEFQIRYNQGIDTLDDMIYFIDEGMVPAIQKGGAWYTIQPPDSPEGKVQKPIKLQGASALREYLESGPDLENVVRRSLRLPMIEEETR